MLALTTKYNRVFTVQDRDGKCIGERAIEEPMVPSAR